MAARHVAGADVVGSFDELRPTVLHGPCGGGPTGLPGRREYACGGESRGPSPGDGCWAERCACSRWSPMVSKADFLHNFLHSPGTDDTEPVACHWRRAVHRRTSADQPGPKGLDSPGDARRQPERTHRPSDEHVRAESRHTLWKARSSPAPRGFRSRVEIPGLGGQTWRLPRTSRHAERDTCRTRHLVGWAGELLAFLGHPLQKFRGFPPDCPMHGTSSDHCRRRRLPRDSYRPIVIHMRWTTVWMVDDSAVWK
jgi:hypothetical protein